MVFQYVTTGPAGFASVYCIFIVYLKAESPECNFTCYLKICKICVVGSVNKYMPFIKKFKVWSVEVDNKRI